MTHPRYWTPAEVAILRQCYPSIRTADLCKLLPGRTVNSIFNQAHKMGLEKSAAYLASDMAKRIRRGHNDPRLKATQFKPGHKPPNKGKSFDVARTHPNCTAHQFKPGRAPHEARNYQPIGTLRIAQRDGLLERKVNDTHPMPARRWEGVHRLVWKAAHGAIPPGHMVVFKSGQKTTVLDAITADKLECISRAENARRNHPRNQSPELAKLTQLKGCITRQVNRITREHREATQEKAAP